ncbi:AraC family transcriptional regulator [uncultured Mycobacterium sp.]|uniref:AraC family transcriptional regulator n=1 Tax=uncultured Mycobacterium sp. TaxID=171292 RepID=UPI0035C9FE69
MRDRLSHHSLRILKQHQSLDFTLCQAKLYDITFLQVSYGNEVEVLATGSADFYVVQLTLEGMCLVTTSEARLEVGPGRVYVVNPRTTYRKRWSADATQLMVRVPRRPMEQLASADSHGAPVIFEQSAHPLPRTLDDLLKFFWRDVTTDGRTRSTPIDRSASRHLMRALLHLLPNSASTAASPHELPACLSRADRYIRQHLAEPIALADIADAAGVTIRSIENAFRRHWRTTPMTHVRNLRLEVAHVMLTEPVAGISVTDAALASGFTHLGRFSKGYVRRFGELPSESLRRALTTKASLGGQHAKSG